MADPYEEEDFDEEGEAALAELEHEQRSMPLSQFPVEASSSSVPEGGLNVTTILTANLEERLGHLTQAAHFSALHELRKDVPSLERDAL